MEMGKGADRREGRTMGEEQAAVSGQEESDLHGSEAVEGFGIPQEMKGMNSGGGMSNRDVNTNVECAGGASASTEVGTDAGPSSVRGRTSGEEAVRIGNADFDRLNESSGAERAGTEENRESGVLRSNGDGSHLPDGGAATTAGLQHQSPDSSARAPSSEKPRDSHAIDIPAVETTKVEDLDIFKAFAVVRTTSNFSVESGTGDQCRICQQHTEEALMELGCHCRGELAKAHRSCVDHWFGNKGTNKCEVCQHVATNVPPPSSQPTPHFWVWRVGGGTYNGTTPRRAGGARFHPLWAALLILIAGLLFDILISVFLGASALPVNIIIGVLVVLGLGTAARLVLECWHERVIRRNIRRMEEEPTFEDFQAEQMNIDININPAEGRSSFTVPLPTAAVQGASGAAEVAATASNMARP